MDSEDKRNEQFVRLEMRLHDIVFCSFNPLKVSPTYTGYFGPRSGLSPMSVCDTVSTGILIPVSHTHR